MRNSSKKSRKGIYKSGLEKTFATLAKQKNLPFEYEPETFSYIIPSHYTPDFRIAKDKFIETKGYLSPSNRMRLLSFKEQYPKVEILLLFGNEDNKLSSKSKSTYRQWAEKHGFRCHDIKRGLPIDWWEKRKSK